MEHVSFLNSQFGGALALLYPLPLIERLGTSLQPVGTCIGKVSTVKNKACLVIQSLQTRPQPDFNLKRSRAVDGYMSERAILAINLYRFRIAPPVDQLGSLNFKVIMLKGGGHGSRGVRVKCEVL